MGASIIRKNSRREGDQSAPSPGAVNYKARDQREGGEHDVGFAAAGRERLRVFTGRGLDSRGQGQGGGFGNLFPFSTVLTCELHAFTIVPRMYFVPLFVSQAFMATQFEVFTALSMMVALRDELPRRPRRRLAGVFGSRQVHLGGAL